MKLNIQKPRNFINPLLSKKSIDKAEFEAFVKKLNNYSQKIKEQQLAKQSEPNIVTNVLKPFVDAIGYNSGAHSQKGQSGADLAIFNNNKPTVIIEVKKANSADMITAIDVNQKAFHEAILYFMREREIGNDNLCHIIITDFNNWFIFDAKDFDRLFWRNPRVKNIFTSHNDPRLLGDSTKEFYAAIKLEIPKLQADLIAEESIDCAHFNIAVSHSEKELIAICKLLSPDCLLKEFNPNDANSLNKEFYTELLYILGLEEIKENGKKIIARAAKPQAGSFYENISNKLGQYTKPNDFESVIKLIIIWVNRILFLKLLESQIVKWTNNPNHRFLNTNKIDEYDALEALFFDILAKPVKSRSSAKFDYIPYLNSSLFESHIDEKNGLYISNLADDTAINYYAKTVVKDANSKRKDGQINTLAYLFEFLSAYDFGSDNDDDEFAANNKPLISSSVLGLIFEKINGYKDGSFYTPSFITMFMARESITRTVIAKFNAAFNWRCETLTDLINKDNVAGNAAEVAASNAIIDNIKICDPAVGSGHFLVSALNEILYIKSALKILVDDKVERIKEYNISVENDELILKAKAGGELFEYQKGDSEKTRVQKTLFKEKQKIIENCLFGVDINPNSVNICRLRLWIELLKNAYYKEDGQLDTLPNIDINIKCGNSLISRFGLSDDLASKTIKAEIQDYKTQVKQYKENIGSKQQVLQAIENIKLKFKTDLKASHASTKKLNDALNQYVGKYSLDGLTSLQKLKAIDELKLIGKQSSFIDDAEDLTDKAKLKKALDNTWLAVQEIESGKIYQSAFEWRFEFPEVLNDDGDFVGFDVVIGNPPYGVSIKNIELRNYLIDQFGKVPDYEIYYMFINLGLKLIVSNGQTSLLIPNTLLFNVYANNFRLNMLDKLDLVEVLDFTAWQLFEDATVKNIVLTVKNTSGNKLGYKNTSGCENLLEYISRPTLQLDYEVVQSNNANWGLLFKLDKNVLDLVKKIRIDNISLQEYFPELSQGLIAYDSYRGQSKEFIESRPLHSTTRTELANKSWINGEDVKPYLVSWNKKDFFEYSDRVANKRQSKFFVGKRVLVREITNPRIFCSYTETELYHDPAIIVILESVKFNLYVLLAILNSKLATYYHFNASPKATKGAFPKILVKDIADFPLPKFVSTEGEKLVIEKVNTIISTKQNNTDTSQLEAEIDAMVYALYGLSDDEIKLIEATNT